MKKHLIFSTLVLLIALGKATAQTYIPYPATGYSLDGVAENTTAVSTTGGQLDNSDFVLYSQYYGTLYSTSAVGLPNNGTIVSGLRTYQLQNYTGFNVMRIIANAKDSLTFVTPQAFPALSLLSFATQGSATVDITVRFTDNSTQLFSAIPLADWFTANPSICNGFDRVARTSGTPAYVGSAGNPRMFGVDLAIACANQGKPIKRVIVQNNSTAFVCVMAVSANVPSYSVTNTPSLICSGSSTTLNATGLTNYSWSPTGAFAGSSSGTITVSPSVTTSYTLTGDISGCPVYSVVSVNVSSGTPTVSLAGSTSSVCLGAAATITASGALTYTLSSPAANGATFTPTTTAVYSVTGANGCGSNTATTTIVVSPLQVSAATSTALVCAGMPATLSAGGAASYTWNPGANTNTNYIVSPQANTIYTVTGKSGNCIGTNTIAITTQPNPTLSIAASSSIVCNGNSSNLTVSGNAVTYTWSTGQTGLSISASPTTVTLYSATGTGANGCINSASQVVLVNQNPTVSISASAMLVCSSGTSTLTASGANTYLWDSNATTTVVVVNPVTGTTYSVTGTSTAGCTGTSMITISVYAPTLGVSSNTAVCSGNNVSISANGADTYTWVNNGSGSQGITVHPTSTTIYTVNGSVTDPASNLSCDASNTVQVTVNPNPAIIASADHTIICRNNSATLTGSGAGAGGTYTWTGGPGPVVNATTVVMPIADQSYTVSGIDANGCKGAASITVKVVVCTGIAENEATVSNLLVYPNPSNGAVIISGDRELRLTIINELGQPVNTLQLNHTNGYRVTVDNLAPGIYFVASTQESGIRNKIVITK